MARSKPNMKTDKFFILLWVALSLGAPTTNAMTAEKDSTQNDDAHGIKIATHVGAKVDKLATLLAQHTKSAAEKSEQTARHIVQHLETDAKKIRAAAKRTVHKVGEKIEKLTE